MSTGKEQLGRLTKVDIKSVWPTEDGHFTKWLAKPENLNLLADDLNLELEPHTTEEAVGPFRRRHFVSGHLRRLMGRDRESVWSHRSRSPWQTHHLCRWT